MRSGLLYLFLLVNLCYMIFFFFFQAEDGIRDLTVTGVQTCALPIFKDRVAIVTGAGSGIGAASALAMAAEGARVVVADVNETAAKAIVEKIERQGGQGLALPVDVARAADNHALQPTRRAERVPCAARERTSTPS